MTPDIKAYLELVVSEFDKRLKNRGYSHSWGASVDHRMKLWEQKIYKGAKKLLEGAPQ